MLKSTDNKYCQFSFIGTCIPLANIFKEYRVLGFWTGSCSFYSFITLKMPFYHLTSTLLEDKLGAICINIPSMRCVLFLWMHLRIFFLFDFWQIYYVKSKFGFFCILLEFSEFLTFVVSVFQDILDIFRIIFSNVVSSPLFLLSLLDYS